MAGFDGLWSDATAKPSGLARSSGEAVSALPSPADFPASQRPAFRPDARRFCQNGELAVKGAVIRIVVICVDRAQQVDSSWNRDFSVKTEDCTKETSDACALPAS